jgi:hypothetical protein
MSATKSIKTAGPSDSRLSATTKATSAAAHKPPADPQPTVILTSEADVYQKYLQTNNLIEYPKDYDNFYRAKLAFASERYTESFDLCLAHLR